MPHQNEEEKRFCVKR